MDFRALYRYLWILSLILLASCRDAGSLGMEAFEEGRYEEAIPLLEEALSANDTLTELRFFLAVCHQMGGDYQQAIGLYDRVIRSDSGAHNALLNRGHCYYALEQWSNALGDYEEVLRIKPSEKVVYNPIAHMKYYLGDTAGACAALAAAAEVFADREVDAALRAACQD